MKRAISQPMKFALRILASTLIAGGLISASAATAGPIAGWQTVVNNGDPVPGTTKNFNSYNQPSVNDNGLVVFRARSQGAQPGGQPATGIFTRDMSTPGNPINPIAARGTTVPQPNNTGATFNEFPSIPRIDASSNMIATRGQSQPVLEYQNGSDPVTTTRGGTSGDLYQPQRPAYDRNERAGQCHQHDLSGKS